MLVYYFKTKDDIIAAVVQVHVDQLEAAFATLERAHRSTKARLKALVGVVGEQARSIAQFGCPYGTLGLELVKRADGVELRAARLMQVRLGWVEEQFHSIGRRDDHGLAVEFVTALPAQCGSHQHIRTTGSHGRPGTTTRTLDRRAHHVNGRALDDCQKRRLNPS